MKSIHLAPVDPSIEDSLHNSAAYAEAMAREDWPKVAEIVLGLTGRWFTDALVVADHSEWGGYLAVDAATREIVGSCGFKGPPSAEGVVEIAYFTYPEFEGRGYATAMAKQLVELALTSSAVKQVVAHTLPEKNASTRVLEKASMQFAGEVTDPDDGSVWQWRKQVAT